MGNEGEKLQSGEISQDYEEKLRSGTDELRKVKYPSWRTLLAFHKIFFHSVCLWTRILRKRLKFLYENLRILYF